MSVSTKGFLHSEQAKSFSYLKLIDYIRENYELTHISPSSSHYMAISFNHNSETRTLSVLSKYTSYVNEGYPQFENTTRLGTYGEKYIILFDVNNWGDSEKIIKGIVQHFGGGFFLKNDCSDDDWEDVSTR